jgi:amino acid adenylation domain-containing protein
VREAFGVEVPLGKLFEAATVADLALVIQAQPTAGAPSRRREPVEHATDVYALSPMQQGILFHSLYEPESGVYVEQVTWRIGGRFERAALERAWRQVVERHPVLRTAFFWKGLDAPHQVVREAVDLPCERHDWSALDESQRQERWTALQDDDRRRGFDLSAAPLLRLTEIRWSEDLYQFLWTYHHLLLDGWSVSLVLGELFQLYAAFSTGRRIELGEAPSYRDYIAWLERQDAQEAETFWRSTLAGVSASPLPRDDLDVASRQEKRYLALRSRLHGGEELLRLARRYQLTPNTLFQGAWAVVLSRYSGQRDVVFGSVVAGRPPGLPGVESMVGLFINTLPVRVALAEERRVADWLQELQARQIEAQRYDYVPLVQVQAWSGPSQQTPLFESLTVFENLPGEEDLDRRSTAFGVHDIGRAEARTGYPLTLEVFQDTTLSFRITYDGTRLGAALVARMDRLLISVLTAMTAGFEGPVADLMRLTPEESHQLLVEWNDAAFDGLGPERYLHERFERQAAHGPERVALVCGSRELSYGELAQRSERLARTLRRLGVGPEVRVGVLLDRTPELVVALLGVLRAGGAYVPLDPAYPAARVSLMLEDSRATVVVTRPELAGRLNDAPVEVLFLDSGELPTPEESLTPLPPLPPKVQPANLAYLIYTSGSTGRPKGVALTHAGAVAMLRWTASVFTLEELAGTLASTSICFDVSVFELFGPLSYGGKMILADNALALPGLAAASEVTLITAVPSALSALLQLGGLPSSVRTLGLGGEPLPGALVREIHERAGSVRVLNLYGPSEDTTYSAWARIERGEELPPIGWPIAGTAVYLLDSELRPVPLGAVGELFLGGAGIARGYLGQPGLTAERFLPDPWSGEPGARLYRTGDLGRRRSSGSLEYLGRIDHQVKLRGFRIELGEIEAVLGEHPEVREVVVVARQERPGDVRLTAYVVPGRGAAPAASVLREHARAALPEYMVPAAWVLLDAFPLTPSGKVDRRALPAPDREAETAGQYTAPRTRVETLLAGSWAYVLGRERVGIHDNFFELGGNSILATQTVATIQELLPVEISLRTVFDMPTVAQLGALLEGSLSRLDEQDRAKVDQILDEFLADLAGEP